MANQDIWLYWADFVALSRESPYLALNDIAVSHIVDVGSILGDLFLRRS